MPRPSLPATKALGAAMQRRRAPLTGDAAAAELLVSRGTYYRLERGLHVPTYETALRLAKWLGWSVEQVMDAAVVEPAGGSAD